MQMSLVLRANWNTPIAANRQNVPFADFGIRQALGYTEVDLKATLWEAFSMGGWQSGQHAFAYDLLYFATHPLPFMSHTRIGANNAVVPDENVTIRQGPHQIEESEFSHGFRLHIGALFRQKNCHLNVVANSHRRLVVTRISAGNPRDAHDYQTFARPNRIQ
jgi:hypothetical protein